MGCPFLIGIISQEITSPNDLPPSQIPVQTAIFGPHFLVHEYAF